MELNYVLCWIAGFSAAIGVLHILGSRHPGARAWLPAYVTVLVILLMGLVVAPSVAGFVGFGAWLTLVVFPLSGARLVQWFSGRDHYRVAAIIEDGVSLVRSGRLSVHSDHLRVLAAVYRGDSRKISRYIDRLAPTTPQLGRFARLQAYSAALDHDGLVAWVEGFVPEGELFADPPSLALYARALGESGGALGERIASWWWHAEPAARTQLALLAAVFAGRAPLVELLFAAPLAGVGPRRRDFWVASALQVAGKYEAAAELLEPHRRRASLVSRRAVEDRLNRPLPARPIALGPVAVVLAGIEQNLRMQVSQALDLRRRWPWATAALIVANLLVFAFEIPGGAEDLDNLVKLGALVVPIGVEGQWWRLVAAGFLHFGWIHVSLNALGLWVLGRQFERVWGSWRLLLCHLAAVIGANAVASVLVKGSVMSPVVMVGASAGVMGILGASLATTALEWWRVRSPVAREKARLFALILAMQMVFDVSTPNVSSVMHISGFVIGTLVGALIALVGSRGSPVT